MWDLHGRRVDWQRRRFGGPKKSLRWFGGIPESAVHPASSHPRLSTTASPQFNANSLPKPSWVVRRRDAKQAISNFRISDLRGRGNLTEAREGRDAVLTQR